MVTHPITFFFHSENVPLHTAYRKCEDVSQQLYKFIAMLSQNRYNQHTMHSSDRENSSTIYIFFFYFIDQIH